MLRLFCDSDALFIMTYHFYVCRHTAQHTTKLCCGDAVSSFYRTDVAVKHKDKMALMPFFFNMLDSVSRFCHAKSVRNDDFRELSES